MKLRKRFKIFLSILVLNLVIFLLFSFIKISRVRCFSQYGECNEDLVKKLAEIQGKPYLITKKRIKEVLAKEVTVRKYTYRYQLPFEFKVEVIESRPKCALLKDNSNNFYLISGEGVILFKRESSNLPTLSVDKKLSSVGEKVDREILFACEVVHQLSKDYKYSIARVEKDKLIVELIGGPNVIFPLEGDKDFLLGAFVLIIDELRNGKIDSKIEKPTIVDLRFKNPVLKYGQN